MNRFRVFRWLSGAATGYGLAAAAVALTWLVRRCVDPFLGTESNFLFFVLPMVGVVLFLGRGPSLFAGLLSLSGGMSFIAPVDRWAASGLIQALAFALICIGIGLLGDRLSIERRQARSSERQLQLLLEGASRYAIFMLDTEGCISTWNAGAQRIFGWQAEKILGQHCSTLLPQDDRMTLAAAQLEAARRTGRHIEEGWQLRADGSEFLSDLTISPIMEKSSDLRGYACVVHDVTDQRADEQALARREKHLQTIMATVPDAMIVIDDKGAIISFSRAAERLFGYDQAFVSGKNVSMLMPSPDREQHDDYIARYISTGVPRIIGAGRIVAGLRADGRTFPMRLAVGEAVSGDQRFFTGFIQDLTEQRSFEAKLEQLESELLHVSRLSAMGTMASTLAHELNQPLTAIATYGQAARTLLEQPGELDRCTMGEVMGEMSAQALRAGGIVRRLRDFVSRGDLAKTVEDLPNLIDEACALALVGIKEKGVSTQFSYAPDATPVLVDRVQIEQVLINLFRNAVEAMENSSERQLTITTSLLDPVTVQVTVRDTGPGISQEVEAQLFEAFNSSKSAGMGLGLSICRTIIESHGGKIEGLSNDTGGAEFRFTLQKPAVNEGGL